MPNPQAIRPIQQSDLPALKEVIDATGLFPSEMLDDMTSSFFNEVSSTDYWLTYDDGEPIAVAYYLPERMTEGTWNILALAVRPDYQSKGIGAALMTYIEKSLAEQGQRIVLVETSGLDEFKRTRAFYKAIGYDQEAVIREFYTKGEDKVIFRKAL